MSTTYAYIDFNNTTSGKIVLVSSVYTASTGWANCRTGESVPAPRTWWRAYFQFDTSGIPDHADIISVDFIVSRAKTQPIGDPQFYHMRFSIGDIIGAALNGNVAEWDGGALVASLTAKPIHGQSVDLTSSSFPYINLTGNTDLKVWDQSSQGTGQSSWSFDFNRKTGIGSKCQLKIAYSVPSGTALGKGYASCSAEVTHDASASATGEGTAELIAEIERLASGTAVGWGFASCVAEVTHHASASVDGQGFASLASYVEHDASASSVGQGFASLKGTTERVGAGTAVGRGFAFLAGSLQYAAAGTLVGRGFASLAGYLDVEPLALHVGTVAVAAADSATVEAIPVDAATIAVVSIDSASLVSVSQDATTITVDPDDVATRGQRRN